MLGALSLYSHFKRGDTLFCILVLYYVIFCINVLKQLLNHRVDSSSQKKHCSGEFWVFSKKMSFGPRQNKNKKQDSAQRKMGKTCIRNSRPEVFFRNLFLETLQNSQESTCAKVSF